MTRFFFGPVPSLGAAMLKALLLKSVLASDVLIDLVMDCDVRHPQLLMLCRTPREPHLR